MSLRVSSATAPDPRYPIGRFDLPAASPISVDDLSNALVTLTMLPRYLTESISGLNEKQLDTPYRAGGWTLRQVVHHVADSHLNAYVRMRLALTEPWPTITPYDENAWAALHDYDAPVQWSLDLLRNLHARWVLMLQALHGPDWVKGYIHPEDGRVTVQMSTLMYAWHSRHHVAHITNLRRERGW